MTYIPIFRHLSCLQTDKIKVICHKTKKNRCEISYFRYAIDDYGRTTNDATLKFYMHVDDVINDLHTNFQTSIVSTDEDMRIRESRYSERFFDTQGCAPRHPSAQEKRNFLSHEL